MTNALPILEELKLVRVPAWWENPWIWFPALVLLAAALWFFVRWWRSRPTPVVPPPPVPAGPPPHLKALERLAQLRSQHPSLSAYAVALECSDILRTYLEARFHVPIRYQTTREFLGLTQNLGSWSPAQKEALRQFLEFFDRLKFARDSAASQETLAALDGVEGFIRACIEEIQCGGASP